MSDAEHRDSDRREHRKRELISQEAAEWFARMKAPRIPLEERRRFLRWLKQSEVHVAEYLTVARIDGDLQDAHLAAVLTDDTPTNVVALFAHAGERAEASREGLWSRWKVVAAIAACGLAALLFVASRSGWHEPSIGTEPGEWKTVTLADGSELQLGPNTLLQLDPGDARRSIALVSGEAYFKIAKDPTRPFFVRANAFAVRATGTEFAVSVRKSELIVTVAAGSVRVAPSKSARDESGELSVPIAADQQLRIRDTWPVIPAQIELRYALAWRDRQLMFGPGDTLADAVVEFNLRNRLQLRLDPSAAALPVRGSFDASDPVAFAQTMAGTAPISVARLAPELLLLTAD